MKEARGLHDVMEGDWQLQAAERDAAPSGQATFRIQMTGELGV